MENNAAIDPGSLLNKLKNFNKELPDKKQAGIGFGLAAADMGINALWNTKSRPSEAKQGISGALKGAQVGLATGNPLVIAGGALLGGVIGFAQGKQELNAFLERKKRQERLKRMEEEQSSIGQFDLVTQNASAKYLNSL